MALASDCLLALLGRLRTSSFESSAAFFPVRGSGLSRFHRCLLPARASEPPTVLLSGVT